jgi:hypothetical protein
MKTVKIISSVLFLFLVGYLVSCGNENSPLGNNVNTVNLKDAPDQGDNCPILSYCLAHNNCFSHFCLYLEDEDGGYISLEDVASIQVSHSGNDCQNNNYSCVYTLTNPGSNPTAGGCYLPNSSNVLITRSVCGSMHDGRRFEGSVTFHPGVSTDIKIVTIRFLSPYEVSLCQSDPD